MRMTCRRTSGSTDPADLSDTFREAADAAGIDAVVAGGGDGTVSCAAGPLAGTGRPLGILPLGTLNHLARDAGIPGDIEEAAAVIAAGHRRAIDVAEVNGRVFVNNSSVGLYPDMVRLREAQQERTGRSKRLAMLSAGLASLRSFRRHRLWISAPGLEAPVRTPLLFVGNNRYQVNLLALGRRERLDEGVLCLYAIRARGRAHLFWAGIRGIFGRLDQQRDFVTAYVDRGGDRVRPPRADPVGRRRDDPDGDAAPLPNPAEGADPHCAGGTLNVRPASVATKRFGARPRARARRAILCGGSSMPSKVSWNVPQ